MSVAILMGSQSDFNVVKDGIKLLKEFDIPVDVRILSAHRTPALLDDFIRSNYGKHRIYIAAAGHAAHLAGAVAAKTCRPVIGLPIDSSSFRGMDALLSTVQMPPGVPVATVAVNGALNAAMLAIEMLAISDETLLRKLLAYREKKAAAVIAQNETLESALEAIDEQIQKDCC